MTHVIAITDKGCDPDLIEIMAGDRVAWRNDDTVIHRIVQEAVDPSPATIDTGDLIQGTTSGEVAFLAPILTSFSCKYHPSTRGAVIVVQG